MLISLAILGMYLVVGVITLFMAGFLFPQSRVNIEYMDGDEKVGMGVVILLWPLAWVIYVLWLLGTYTSKFMAHVVNFGAAVRKLLI